MKTDIFRCFQMFSDIFRCFSFMKSSILNQPQPMHPAQRFLFTIQNRKQQTIRWGEPDGNRNKA